MAIDPKRGNYQESVILGGKTDPVNSVEFKSLRAAFLDSDSSFQKGIQSRDMPDSIKGGIRRILREYSKLEENPANATISSGYIASSALILKELCRGFTELEENLQHIQSCALKLRGLTPSSYDEGLEPNAKGSIERAQQKVLELHKNAPKEEEQVFSKTVQVHLSLKRFRCGMQQIGDKNQNFSEPSESDVEIMRGVGLEVKEAFSNAYMQNQSDMDEVRKEIYKECVDVVHMTEENEDDFTKRVNTQIDAFYNKRGISENEDDIRRYSNRPPKIQLLSRVNSMFNNNSLSGKERRAFYKTLKQDQIFFSLVHGQSQLRQWHSNHKQVLKDKSNELQVCQNFVQNVHRNEIENRIPKKTSQRKRRSVPSKKNKHVANTQINSPLNPQGLPETVGKSKNEFQEVDVVSQERVKSLELNKQKISRLLVDLQTFQKGFNFTMKREQNIAVPMVRSRSQQQNEQYLKSYSQRFNRKINQLRGKLEEIQAAFESKEARQLQDVKYEEFLGSIGEVQSFLQKRTSTYNTLGYQCSLNALFKLEGIENLKGADSVTTPEKAGKYAKSHVNKMNDYARRNSLGEVRRENNGADIAEMFTCLKNMDGSPMDPPGTIFDELTPINGSQKGDPEIRESDFGNSMTMSQKGFKGELKDFWNEREPRYEKMSYIGKGEAPPNFYLKRNSFHKVPLDSETITFGPEYVLNNTSEKATTYELEGFSCHGSTHYVTYKKIDDEYFLFDDMDIHPITRDEYLQASGKGYLMKFKLKETQQCQPDSGREIW